jgi:hypothetical protein
MNEYGDSFIGGNFLWFTGVIEDVNDPEEMGRYRVRCFGYHSDNKGDIPTEDLPWSNVMMPISSASTSGIGQSATGLVQGSWVIGFFRDGNNAQDSIIMGSIPSMFETRPNYDAGFTDPDQVYPIEASLGKPDTPQPARKDYKDSAVYKSKAARSSISVTPTAPEGGTATPWSLPSPSKVIEPIYPNNHVYQSESGHVVEFDDTSGKERISVFHKSGSYDEVNARETDGKHYGDRSVVIVGDSYEVVIQNKNIYITGDLNLNVDGNMNTKITKNYTLDVGEEMKVNVGGSQTNTIGGSQTITVGGNQTMSITGNQDISAAVTKINNNVDVTGTITATVDVKAGTQNIISLVNHTHNDTPGLGAGKTSPPNP